MISKAFTISFLLLVALSVTFSFQASAQETDTNVIFSTEVQDYDVYVSESSN